MRGRKNRVFHRWKQPEEQKSHGSWPWGRAADVLPLITPNGIMVPNKILSNRTWTTIFLFIQGLDQYQSCISSRMIQNLGVTAARINQDVCRWMNQSAYLKCTYCQIGKTVHEEGVTSGGNHSKCEKSAILQLHSRPLASLFFNVWSRDEKGLLNRPRLSRHILTCLVCDPVDDRDGYRRTWIWTVLGGAARLTDMIWANQAQVNTWTRNVRGNKDPRRRSLAFSFLPRCTTLTCCIRFYVWYGMVLENILSILSLFYIAYVGYAGNICCVRLSKNLFHGYDYGSRSWLRSMLLTMLG